MTTVVKVDRKNKNFDVYIGRAWAGLPASKWGNPFRFGKDGTHGEVLDKYEQYVRSSPYLMAALPELQDKVLGCWCKPRACHGDVLVRLLEEHTRFDLSSVLKHAPAGEWIALSNDKRTVIAHAERYLVAVAEAKQKGEERPVMVRMPTEDEGRGLSNLTGAENGKERPTQD